MSLKVLKHSRLLLAAGVAFLFCIIWRPIVALLLWLKHGKRARIMEGIDSSQVEVLPMGSPRHANHTNCVWILEGQSLTIEELLSKFSQMLKDKDTFWKLKMCSRIFLGYWVWIPADDFDLSHHVRASPVCKYKDRNHLARLVTEFRRQEPCFSTEVSPWLVQVFFSADGTETAINIHADHSIMDALGLFHIMGPALADNFKHDALPKLPAEPFFKSGFGVILRNAYYGILEVARYTGEHCPDKNPILDFAKKFETATSIGMWSERIPMERIKSIAKKWNTGFTTLLLACLSEAADKLMEKVHNDNTKHHRIREYASSNELSVSCVATYSNWHQKSRKRLGNSFAATIRDLPSNFNLGGMGAPTSITLPERLKALDCPRKKEEAHRGAEFLWSVTSIISKIASFRIANQLVFGLLGRADHADKPSPFTLTLTNALSYQSETDVCGHRVKDILAFMPLVPLIKGPSCLLLTYNGNAVIGITGDSCFFPTQDSVRVFLEDVVGALEWLEQKTCS